MSNPTAPRVSLEGVFYLYEALHVHKTFFFDLGPSFYAIDIWNYAKTRKRKWSRSAAIVATRDQLIGLPAIGWF